VRPPDLSHMDDSVYDTYECPAGSCIIFTEAVRSLLLGRRRVMGLRLGSAAAAVG
jgi:hypothetical protein